MKNIRLIELEIFGHCNRRCPWCPNKDIDRRSEQYLMDEEVFKKIIQELKDFGYDKTISFSRYNEPFSNIEIFRERLNYIREQLPNVKLVTNTNGDFIFNNTLDGIEIDELSIMDYDNHGEMWVEAKLNSINAEIDSRTDKYIYAHRGNMKILYELNWSRNNVKRENKLDDRGGILENVSKVRDERTKPCMEPTYFIGIDYNGSIVPCCNIRSDHPAHLPYVSGNVKDNTLDEIYKNSCSFRLSTANGLFKEYSPCTYCQKNPGRYTKDEPGIEYKE